MMINGTRIHIHAPATERYCDSLWYAIFPDPAFPSAGESSSTRAATTVSKISSPVVAALKIHADCMPICPEVEIGLG
jgi:hypothetical protein